MLSRNLVLEQSIHSTQNTILVVNPELGILKIDYVCSCAPWNRPNRRELIEILDAFDLSILRYMEGLLDFIRDNTGGVFPYSIGDNVEVGRIEWEK